MPYWSPTRDGPARRDQAPLESVAQRKRDEVGRARERRSLDEVRAAALGADAPRNLRSALEGPLLRLIAEIRRPARSPRTSDVLFDPRIIAQEFAGGGAAALSVSTDDAERGSELHLIRRARSYMALPVVCWDFIVDPYQVYEVRAHRADAIALIVGLVSDDELQRLLATASELAMSAVLVVRDAWELDSALAAEAEIICVDNRDPADGGADLARTERLARHLPGEVLLVSAHGIASCEDAERAAAAGADAVLFDAPADYELARDAIRDLRGIAVGRREAGGGMRENGNGRGNG